jgi:hypothetical protein
MTENVEISEGDGQLFTPKALNSPSPRFSSFTAFAKGERFINPFFRLLDSPDKNAKIS